MEKPKFVYVTYIRTTPKKLWAALMEPKFTKKYFMGITHETTWKKGAAWKMVLPDGTVTDSGKVLEIEPYKKIVLAWRNEFRPELKAEGFSRMTYQLEEKNETVKLTVLHEVEKSGSKLLEAVSNGWPMILSNLKSLLETGEVFEEDAPCSEE